jgi:hypothetical protein
MNFGVGGTAIWLMMIFAGSYQIAKTDSQLYLLGGLVVVGFGASAILSDVVQLTRELYFCRKFLEKKYGEDPCDPVTDLYKEIRKTIHRS